MKIMRTVMLSVIIILSSSTMFDTCAEELVTSTAINIEVEVEEVFGFKIEADEYDQKLYPFSDDEEKQQGELHISVSTNCGIYWAIEAACSGLYMDDQTGYGIPLVISTSGESLNGKTVDDMLLESTPKYIYTCGPNERYVDGLLIYSDFKVKKDAIPLYAGIYRGTMMLTMTGILAPR